MTGFEPISRTGDNDESDSVSWLCNASGWILPTAEHAAYEAGIVGVDEHNADDDAWDGYATSDDEGPDLLHGR